MRTPRPVVRRFGRLFYIKKVHPCNVSFLWNPIPVRPAIGLEELDRIGSWHSYGHPVLFKPSIDEVIKSIPANLLPKVVAFETLGDTACDAGEKHLAQTILYRRRRLFKCKS